MSTVATIRAAILDVLQAVTDIGVVNDFERYTQAMSDLRTQCVTTIGADEQLRGWHIRRLSYRETLVDSERWSVLTQWRIRGFMALSDAAGTEKTFDDLIDAAADAFRADPTLGGVVFSTLNPQSDETGLQLVQSRPVLFAGVLCHSAELNLYTQHLI